MKKLLLLILITFIFGCQSDKQKMKLLIENHFTETYGLSEFKIEKIKIDKAYNFPRNNYSCHRCAMDVLYVKYLGLFMGSKIMFEPKYFIDTILHEKNMIAELMDTTEIVGYEVWCRYKYRNALGNTQIGRNRYVIDNNITKIMVNDTLDVADSFSFGHEGYLDKLQILDIEPYDDF